MREQGIVSASLREEEKQFEAALRPTRLADFAGQANIKENLSIAIEAAKLRGEAMDHMLLLPRPSPGWGKRRWRGLSRPSWGYRYSRRPGRSCRKSST